ncbi:hypothetical protein, partial [Halomonas sp. BC1]|uniref:hypothetical protein n=1 Tax=Halomonas sp. BC1 TaxID=1670448 RepID=UPI001C388626
WVCGGAVGEGGVIGAAGAALRAGPPLRVPLSLVSLAQSLRRATGVAGASRKICYAALRGWGILL